MLRGFRVDLRRRASAGRRGRVFSVRRPHPAVRPPASEEAREVEVAGRCAGRTGASDAAAWSRSGPRPAAFGPPPAASAVSSWRGDAQPVDRHRHRPPHRRDRAPVRNCAPTKSPAALIDRCARYPPRGDYPGMSIDPPVRSEMAVNLVNVEAVGKVYGTRALLDGVSLGVSARATGSVSSGATATARPPSSGCSPSWRRPDTGRVTHSGGLRLGVLTQHDSPRPGGDRPARGHRRPRRPRVGGRRQDPRRADRALRRAGPARLPAGPGHRHRPALRRRAPPDRARQAAHRRAGPDRPRRAHQPPRRRGHLLAGPAPAEPALRAGLRHPRPVVPRPGLHPHVGRAARRRPRVRGRLQRLRLRARRAGADRRHRGGQAAEPDAQGAGLAAARRPRPYVASRATASRPPTS